MIKRLTPILFLLGIFSMIACEPNNPFAAGPVYDVAANLKIDSVKIAAYLDTAKIDSIYRIHDRSGVVIIVQEEGVGSRPTLNTVVYSDYIGSLMQTGSIFDTTFEQVARDNNILVENRVYGPFSFIMGNRSVFEGFDIGFSRLRPRSKAIFVIPSPYGNRDLEDNDRIPENSILIFKVDFLGID